MPDTDNTFMLQDGVEVPLPKPEEWTRFEQWMLKNKVKEPFNPAEHYDYVSAFREGVNRNKGHFPDTFKLPGHETFSIESKYYKKGMPAGKWEGEKYIPIDRDMVSK